MTGTELRKMRQDKKLTQQEVADMCSVTKSMVNATENGFASAAKPVIEKFFSTYSGGFDGHILLLSKKQLAEKNEGIKRHFEVGKRYIISSKKINALDTKTFMGTTWENDCVFEFTGNTGIHHCFKAVPGGWSRTYTDAQLVGKKIKEVHDYD